MLVLGDTFGSSSCLKLDAQAGWAYVTLVSPIPTTKQNHMMQSDMLKVVESVDTYDKISKAGNIDKYVQMIKWQVNRAPEIRKAIYTITM